LIVVDASLVLELALVTDRARTVRERLRAANDQLVAPHVLDLEVLQALRRLERLRHIGQDRAATAVAFLASFPISRIPHEPYVQRIWALRKNMTAYDAAYLALAESQSAPLWTFDRKYSGTPGHSARIEVL
jgi:predicted nucleic acid-binding protein